MALREPASMEECVYFTNRVSPRGKIRAWVFREICPQCKKELMGKPKLRAEIYICPACSYSTPFEAYEDTLTTNIQYTCENCLKTGELQVPFKRKKVKIFDGESQKEKSADAIVFHCLSCQHKLYVTKKMK